MENKITIFYELFGKLYLNLTNRCTNACEFCIRDYDDGSYTKTNLWIEHEPSLEEIIKDLERFDVKKYPEVVLCGYGEPLLRLNEAVGICKYLKENYNCPIRINTNGLASFANGVNAAEMLCGLCDTVSVSLNQKNAKAYNELCHPVCGEKAFDEIIAFVKEAKKYIPRIILSVVDVIPKEDIKECKKIADALGTEFRIREKI